MTLNAGQQNARQLRQFIDVGQVSVFEVDAPAFLVQGKRLSQIGPSVATASAFSAVAFFKHRPHMIADSSVIHKPPAAVVFHYDHDTLLCFCSAELERRDRRRAVDQPRDAAELKLPKQMSANLLL